MIFLDTASTTKVKPKVKAEVNKFLNTNYANPMAVYGFADEPREAIYNARKTIADILDCEPDNIIFTSGGSESNNLAIKGAAFRYYADHRERGHIITTEIEHHSVLNACKELEEMGIAEVTYIKPTEEGRILDSMLFENIKNNTFLISICWANNEIGTVQRINRLAKIAHRFNILFHSDGVQAFCKIPTNIKNVDFMSASGHKWGAPKGIGFLYIKNPAFLMPLISGGNQEYGLRGGTHNVPYISGMGVAAKIADINRQNNHKHETAFRLELWHKLSSLYRDLKLNGHPTASLPNILNINMSEYGVRGEEMQAFLAEREIFVSTGSACATGEASHVLKAIGLSDEEVDCSIRLSFNECNTSREVSLITLAIGEGINYLMKGR